MMYTVARFLANASAMDRMLEIRATMNSLRGENFTDVRQRGDGIVCTVCNGELWSAHERAIAEFLAEFAGPIRQARDAGVSVMIDIAIEAEGRERATSYICLSLAPALLLTMGSAGVGLEVTSY